MANDINKYLEDIVLCIEQINDFQVNINGFIDYNQNIMVIKAVERNL